MQLLSSEVCGQGLWAYNSKPTGRCLSFCSASSGVLSLILGPRFADHRDISKQNEGELHGLRRDQDLPFMTGR